MNAFDAEQAGLLDTVVTVPKGQDQVSYLKQQAVYYARSIAKTPFEDRRTRYKKCEKMDDFYYDNALQMTQKMARGHVAPAKGIEAGRQIVFPTCSNSGIQSFATRLFRPKSCHK